MITVAALVLLAAPPPPTPTPTPTPPPIRVLLQGEQHAEEEGGQPRAKSLSELAKTIKLKLPADRPRRLTNESIKELAKGVELTTGLAFPADAAATETAGSGREGAREEWQRRYQQARARAKYWEERVGRLEAEVARLETQFYAMDDPAYRDGVIKPAWDRALTDLRTAREQVVEARKEPERVLEEARRAGALPGWFRGLPEPDAEAVEDAAPAPRS